MHGIKTCSQQITHCFFANEVDLAFNPGASIFRLVLFITRSI
jgi:hypothetical protein